MASAKIPTWTATGVLPPVNPHNPTGPDRSPYRVSLVDMILRYSTSERRRKILNGLLQFRGELHKRGLRSGFQWIDGSFLENVEEIEGRDPNDVDVVTFLESSAEFATPDAPTSPFDSDFVKRTYFVDSYYVELNQLRPTELVELTTYWYSLWSHRRTAQWKGFLQIDLDSVEDATAAENLQRIEEEEAAR